MNINDYSTKVKILADALTSIKAHVDDEDLMAVTLNGLGKYYSQFHTLIVVRETFPNFQNLITLLISEEMRIVDISSNGGQAHMMDIINMKVNLIKVDEETLEEKEVLEVMVQVIEVNNQIATQIVTTIGNMGTWQIIVIKWEHDAQNGKLQQGNYASTSN
jgi:hypothetical protein